MNVRDWRSAGVAQKHAPREQSNPSKRMKIEATEYIAPAIIWAALGQFDVTTAHRPVVTTKKITIVDRVLLSEKVGARLVTVASASQGRNSRISSVLI